MGFGERAPQASLARPVGDTLGRALGESSKTPSSNRAAIALRVALKISKEYQPWRKPPWSRPSYSEPPYTARRAQSSSPLVAAASRKVARNMDNAQLIIHQVLEIALLSQT